MRVQLRPFQATMKAAIVAAWLTVPTVLAVLPTGAGKTVLFSDIILDEPGAVCAVAHRQELVSQISLALARNGVRHRIIGGKQLQKACASLHMSELRCNYVDANSRVAVAGVDTLIKMDPKDPWFASVKLWVMDEAHHVLRENKWGKAVAMFPNARGLGVTATPCRADGYGLGVGNDGVFHEMIVGPTMRELIKLGYLTEYRIFCPPSDVDYSAVPITASGELSLPKLRDVVHKSKSIVGDVVKHYLRIAPGKLGITFAVDIESANDIARAYRAAGVPSEVVSSKTPDLVRASIMRRFKNREVMQLVNVDLFGEGFDLPAIEVVTMVRRTESYSLYAQQFGRVLRLLEGKFFGIIIDHVGNVVRHGLPDKYREWSLSRRDRRSQSKPDEDAIPMTVCVECASPYERIYACCIHCGHKVEPASRSGPEFVDGDLMELTAEVLAKMRGDVDAVNSSWVPIPDGVPAYVAQGIKNKHFEKQQVQAVLRDTIALWAGWHKSQGRSDSEIYRLFYLAYGVDIMTAQTLAPKDANALRDKLQTKLDESRIVPA
jgi:DNA repair protein RadD